MDLLILGFILNYSGFIETIIWKVKHQEMSLAGIIVFTYGFVFVDLQKALNMD